MQFFLSHAEESSFEADLLKAVIEAQLSQYEVRVWSYKKDQKRNQQNIARAIREQVEASAAVIFLVTWETVSSGATQWTELAYADAFRRPTFPLLHQLSYAELKVAESGVPPLLLQAHCIPAVDWRLVLSDLEKMCAQEVQQ